MNISKRKSSEAPVEAVVIAPKALSFSMTESLYSAVNKTY